MSSTHRQDHSASLATIHPRSFEERLSATVRALQHEDDHTSGVTQAVLVHALMSKKMVPKPQKRDVDSAFTLGERGTGEEHGKTVRQQRVVLARRSIMQGCVVS